MTRQEMFDKAYRGLAAQSFRPSKKEGPSGDCVYRGPNGMKCAVGFLIDDETALRMEGYGQIKNCFECEIAMPFDRKDVEFLSSLQDAHDRSRFPSKHDSMKKMLEKVAVDFNLTVPEL